MLKLFVFELVCWTKLIQFLQFHFWVFSGLSVQNKIKFYLSMALLPRSYSVLFVANFTILFAHVTYSTQSTPTWKGTINYRKEEREKKDLLKSRTRSVQKRYEEVTKCDLFTPEFVNKFPLFPCVRPGNKIAICTCHTQYRISEKLQKKLVRKWEFLKFRMQDRKMNLKSWFEIMIFPNEFISSELLSKWIKKES